jgi:hypothetical protein
MRVKTTQVKTVKSPSLSLAIDQILPETGFWAYNEFILFGLQST